MSTIKRSWSTGVNGPEPVNPRPHGIPQKRAEQTEKEKETTVTTVNVGSYTFYRGKPLKGGFGDSDRVRGFLEVYGMGLTVPREIGEGTANMWIEMIDGAFAGKTPDWAEVQVAEELIQEDGKAVWKHAKRELALRGYYILGDELKPSK